MDGQTITLGLGVIGAFLTIFRIWYNINTDINKKIDTISSTFAKQLAAALKEEETKRARIYDRLDEVKSSFKSDVEVFKKDVADNYVPLRICSLTHDNAEKSMTEVKFTINQMNLKIDKLDEKIEKIVVKVLTKEERN